MTQPFYLYLDHFDRQGEQPHRTVDLGDGILVDLREDGRIAGVEHLNGPVTVAVLRQVLRAVHWHVKERP